MAQDLFDPQRRPIYFYQEGIGTFYPARVFYRKPNAERRMTLNGLVIKVKKLSESRFWSVFPLPFGVVHLAFFECKTLNDYEASRLGLEN